MSKVNQMKRDIEKDINSIREALSNKNIDEMMKIHKYMDSKYQSKINTWGLSQYGWGDGLGFNYNFIDESGIAENLENMIGKLEGYKQYLDLKVYEIFNGKSSSDVKIYNSNENTNANTNNNTNVNFSTVEKNLKNNESLTEEQTNEALEKLEELKSIYQSKDNNKIKWSKIKQILIWLADKSVDVGIAFLPLITSMFGG